MGALTGLPAKLFLGQNNLERGGIIGVRDRVVKNADSADHLAGDLGLAKSLNVGGVANHDGGLGLLSAALDADNLAGLEQDLVDVGVEHVGAAVDGTQARERLGKTTKPVDRVQEG